MHQLDSSAFTSPAAVLCFLPEPERTSGVPLKACCFLNLPLLRQYAD